MSLNIEDSRTDLIIKLQKIIDEKLKADEAFLVKEFLEQFYLGVSPYDLREKGMIDLYGALLSVWHFINKRQPGELKLQVYNPQLEQNGWQSPHTVIEIVYDNKPFILDSIRLALNRLDINIHLMINAEGIKLIRDQAGQILEILPLNYHSDSSDKEYSAEAPIYIEIDKQTDAEALEKIEATLKLALEDVDLVVKDWREMLDRLLQITSSLEPIVSSTTTKEVIEFLRWLAADHFTFIGYAEYNYENDDQGQRLEYVKGSGLGVLADSKHKKLTRNFDSMYPDAREAILGPDILLFGKTDTLSSVHRPVYTDFVGIKIFDEQGRLLRLKRFIGLYTATVYNEPASHIPYIRDKIDRIFSMAGFPRDNHDGRSLLHIIENLPRDELIQAYNQDLFNVAIGILHLQERQRIRLFMRRDIYGRYFSCLVFVPREMFNSELRCKISDILCEQLQGQTVTFDTKFSESILARIQFMIRVDPHVQIEYDPAYIEGLLVEAGRGWKDDLYDALIDHLGEEKTSTLYRNYENAFPVSYREIFDARTAVIDIEHMEKLREHDEDHLEMSLYRPIEDSEDSFRFKLFRNSKTIPLSDVVPILEHMGLRIISERPHEIRLNNGSLIWINDYRMIHPRGTTLSPELVKDIFQGAFAAAWHSTTENDGFNKLVLGAQLDWRDISILRMYYRYLWQTGMVFSQASVEEALYNNSDLAKLLLKFFYTKFDLSIEDNNRAKSVAEIKKDILAKLEDVSNLNEDRIINYYLGTMIATVRTNYFQSNDRGHHKNYISIKLDSAKVPDLPLPKPVYEIFVYSTEVEGIHLRADKVARGGLRWSDRHEDFRTEVLGLMKAQQVKNAVIVPLGAKGGFVAKMDVQDIADRDRRMQIGTDCYRTFIRGLLDLTDNRKGDEVMQPKDTICWDKEDTYLVVAADKGTATFSDIANAIAEDYGFWLGDAFASGGSAGYDHKKMGITARGAWESVRMHFKHLGIDVQKDPITVIGIGDMSGDVFGNGMLLSETIKLVAAFNHLNIFIDPKPDPTTSFQERKRLFELPTSTWEDYNTSLISKGGGVFSRSAKRIPLSPEMQELLDCKMEHIEPNQLIRAILMLDIDLYFNGGIGTFVKATAERNSDVGDRANDSLRINGNQLNVRVVCEGGNLGLTQLGRIEFAKNGGIINTDAIDNSAGVNCSDNEVNIKILLNELVQAGDLTEKQRNQLLESMTNEVGELVLANNIKQNEAITVASHNATADLQMHNRLLKELEKNAGLDPEVEYLPDSEEVAKRASAGYGFTRPEIAVLMAYAKIQLKRDLLDSDLPEDPYVINELSTYFPKQLHQKKYKKFIQAHRLKRAIIATQVSNYVIDEMGINFVQRLQEESGATSAQIAKAYIIAREVFNVFDIRAQIRNLSVEVDGAVRIGMMSDLNRLIRRATRWYLRNLLSDCNVTTIIEQYKELVMHVQQNIDQVLKGAWLEKMEQKREDLIEAGVPKDLSAKAATFSAMFTALDIVTAARQYDYSLEEVTNVYFELGAKLKMGWLGEIIKEQPVLDNWDALARAALRDDLDKQQRHLTLAVMHADIKDAEDISSKIDKWFSVHDHIRERWMYFINELKATTTRDFTMFAVALRELLDLTQSVSVSNDSQAD